MNKTQPLDCQNSVVISLFQVKMDLEETRSKISAAQKLLLEETTSREKFAILSLLLRGLNSKTDHLINKISQVLNDYEKLKNEEIIELSAARLPERNEEERKRKRRLLLLLGYWRELRSEVERLRAELHQSSKPGGSLLDRIPRLNRIVSQAKGPLGLITLAAAAVILGGNLLEKVSPTEITILNRGCETIYPQVRLPISLPGIEIPKGPIADGGRAVLKLPPLDLNVNYINRNKIKLSAYGLSLEIDAAEGVDPIFNGESLWGKITQIKLSQKMKHELILSCSPRKSI